jgi:hypothetical protein
LSAPLFRHCSHWPPLRAAEPPTSGYRSRLEGSAPGRTAPTRPGPGSHRPARPSVRTHRPTRPAVFPNPQSHRPADLTEARKCALLTVGTNPQGKGKR